MFIMQQDVHVIDGKIVRVEFAQQEKKGTKIIKTRRISLSIVEGRIGVVELLNHYAKYGTIELSRVLDWSKDRSPILLFI